MVRVGLCGDSGTRAVAGCSGGGGGSDTPTATTGQAVASTTDAAGDLLSYTADAQSLALTKQNGWVVEMLPLTTRINFAA